MPAVTAKKKPSKKANLRGRDNPEYYDRAVLRPAERLAALLASPAKVKSTSR